MVFTEDSMLVQLWVKWLQKPDSPYTRENVPNLHNLREMVYAILE